MAEKFRKIWQNKTKTLLFTLAGIVFILIQVPLIEAYEAHVINVTARIVQPCENHSISGYKFFDHNQNGVRDEGEEGLAGWIIELDKIYDQRFDYNSDNLVDGSDQLILQDVADDVIPCPDDKLCDINRDGWVDNVDVGLFPLFPQDLGNQLTDNNGYYQFNNLEEGTYVINEIPQDSWTPTTPTTYTVALQCGNNEVNFGNFREGQECPALSIGYWQNHEGCPAASNWTDEINALSDTELQGAFATITGSEICTLLAPSNCPPGGTLNGQLCRAKGKALADLSNIVSGRLDPAAVIAGADDGSVAFDNLGLTPLSTIQQALYIIEVIINSPSHTKAQLTDAAYVGERIYSFYEDENPNFPACLYSWEEPALQILGLEPGAIIIPGCLDQTALNYNPDATDDDGTCQYEEVLMSVPGCMDSTAQNYNSEAT